MQQDYTACHGYYTLLLLLHFLLMLSFSFIVAELKDWQLVNITRMTIDANVLDKALKQQVTFPTNYHFSSICISNASISHNPPPTLNSENKLITGQQTDEHQINVNTNNNNLTIKEWLLSL